MQEMDELYKDRPTHTNTYEVDGVKHTVISHFIGDRDINDEKAIRKERRFSKIR